MLIDGKAIALEIGERIQGEIAAGSLDLTLLVVQVGNNPASTSFIKMKRAFAERVGIKVALEQLPESVSTGELVRLIEKANTDKKISGIIVQLPLPANINTREVLDAIAPVKDPDLLSSESQARFAAGESEILPPVVAAISQIFDNYQVAIDLANIAIVGYGQLVGQPVGKWLQNMGIDFALITSENENPEAILSKADIIISGVGKPGLIKPNMIKDEVVLIDAGTSEAGGVMKGDADAASQLVPPGFVGVVCVVPSSELSVSGRAAGDIADEGEIDDMQPPV